MSTPSTPDPGVTDPPPVISPSFWDWLDRLGLRRSDERWLGGVAAGIAARLGIDPVLVRVALVVLGLMGGVGAFAYALAWLLLPDSAGRIEARQVLAGEVSAGATVGLGVLAVSVLVPGPWTWWSAGPLVDGGDVAGVVLIAAVLVAAVVLVPKVRRQSADRAAGEVPFVEPSTGASAWRPVRAPRWRRPAAPSWLSSAVFGLAVLVATGTWLALRGPTTAEALGLGSNPHLAASEALAVAMAAAAAVFAVALVVVGALGRRSASLGTWGTLALLVALAAAVVPAHGSTQVVGEHRWRPTTVTAAERGFSMVVGETVVDLSALSAPDDGSGPITVPVRLGAGSITVTAPEGTSVALRGRLFAGDVRAVDPPVTTAATAGPDSTWSVAGDTGGLLPDTTLTPSGTADVVVDVRGLAGQVTLTRSQS